MKKTLQTVIVAAAMAASAQAGEELFRVTPYVQRPATNAMTVLWLTAASGNATIEWWENGREASKTSAVVSPRQATELDYFGYSHSKQYLPSLIPWQY